MATDRTYVPAEYNTGIVRGDYFSQQFSITVDGEVVDLSGSDVRIQIRTDAGKLLDSFTVGGGIEVAENVITWTSDSVRTEEYHPQVYRWDMEVILAGNARTYAAGTFTVIKDQTV